MYIISEPGFIFKHNNVFGEYINLYFHKLSKHITTEEITPDIKYMISTCAFVHVTLEQEQRTGLTTEEVQSH